MQVPGRSLLRHSPCRISLTYSPEEFFCQRLFRSGIPQTGEDAAGGCGVGRGQGEGASDPVAVGGGEIRAVVEAGPELLIGEGLVAGDFSEEGGEVLISGSAECAPALEIGEGPARGMVGLAVLEPLEQVFTELEAGAVDSVGGHPGDPGMVIGVWIWPGALGDEGAGRSDPAAPELPTVGEGAAFQGFAQMGMGEAGVELAGMAARWAVKAGDEADDGGIEGGPAEEPGVGVGEVVEPGLDDGMAGGGVELEPGEPLAGDTAWGETGAEGAEVFAGVEPCGAVAFGMEEVGDDDVVGGAVRA